MDSIQDRGEDQLVILLSIAENIDRHICVAPEYNNVIIDVHNVILIHVELGSGCASILLVGLCEDLLLKNFLQLIVFKSLILILVIVLCNNSSALVVKDNDSFDVAYHVSENVVHFVLIDYNYNLS